MKVWEKAWKRRPVLTSVFSAQLRVPHDLPYLLWIIFMLSEGTGNICGVSNTYWSITTTPQLNSKQYMLLLLKLAYTHGAWRGNRERTDTKGNFEIDFLEYFIAFNDERLNKVWMMILSLDLAGNMSWTSQWKRLLKALVSLWSSEHDEDDDVFG